MVQPQIRFTSNFYKMLHLWSHQLCWRRIMLENWKINGKSTKFDFKRNAIFTSVGFFYVAPLSYLNYNFFLPALVPAKAKYGALKKLVLDQSIFDSALVAGFFIIMNKIEGNSN